MKKVFKFIFTILILFIYLPATTYTVDDDGTAQFTTIQEAVDASVNGDTVFVMPGVYYENVTIYDKSINLIGYNKNSTIISSADFGYLIRATEEGNSFSNITFNGNDKNADGLEISNGVGLVENCIIENCGIGIYFEFGSDNYQSNSDMLIKNNKINNNYDGIHINVYGTRYPDSIKITNNDIFNNQNGIVYFPEHIWKKGEFDSLWQVNVDSNYWGYTDSISIANSIYDRNDHSQSIAQYNFKDWFNEPIDSIIFFRKNGINYNNIFENIYYNIHAGNYNVGIEHENNNQLIDEYIFTNVYPNPFNPETMISYQLSFNSNVELTVFNVFGQKIKILLNKKMPAGVHQVIWNGKNDIGQNVSSGVYFYRLSINNKSGIKSFTEKMVLLR